MEVDLQEIAKQLSCPHGEAASALGEKMNLMNEFITARTIDELAPASGETILEIGFGNGKLSSRILDAVGRHGHYTGIETSQALALEARSRFEQEGITNASIQIGDCHEARLDTHSLDGILAVNLLYFIDDLDRLFARLHNWLKPGARLVFGVRSARSLRNMPFTDQVFRIRHLDEIIHALNDCGFRELTTKYFDEGSVPFGDLSLHMDTCVISGRKPL